MNQEIIDNYQIKFQNEIVNHFGFGSEINKTVLTNIPDLSIFLFNFNLSDLNNNLLPDIDYALSNPGVEIENGSEIIDINIYHDKVVFFGGNNPNFSIPTLDFQQIVIGWRDFLLTPPLNGTKV